MDKEMEHFMMSSLPKMICRFNTTPIKSSTAFFAGMEKLILKFIWDWTGPQRAKMVQKKKNEIAGLTLLDFEIYTRLQE